MTLAMANDNPLFRKLASVTQPAESKKLETKSAAMMAWAKEENDYEAYVGATYVYILARRKTTELLKPHVKHGGNRQGNTYVTLTEKTGFTKMQWNRRTKELDAEVEKIEEYFNECISNGWHPSLAGAVKYATTGIMVNTPKPEQVTTCPSCGAVIRG